ncbi:hypothetical protein C3941_19745 [Kaistia algarum]|uniref:hypothetical protein n=1 Tax=Kaistia algarum TaxID=2083279 RepID=UPI000CE7AEB3|nr:hypothetical protein [Kaistia algarum]MCX5516225.1 hypothetical protein [Kaistia algarum]PPE78297.1 hypothetical protein C3941_19745 [Kaistia algarum]
MVLPAYVRKGKNSAAVGDFGSLAVAGNAAIGGYPLLSVATTITARAGGGKTNATLLAAAINHVTVVATAADSVKLPASVAGMVVVVINGQASNSMQVFGSGSDTVNDVATGTGVAQGAGLTAIYFCPVAGKWYRTLSA